MITSLGKTAILVSEGGIPKVAYSIENDGESFHLVSRELSGNSKIYVLMSGSEEECQNALHGLMTSLHSKDTRDTLYRRISRCAATGLGGFLALALLATIARPHVAPYSETPDALKMQQMQQMQQMMMQDGLQGLGVGGMTKHPPSEKTGHPALPPTGEQPSPSHTARPTGKVFSFDSMIAMPKAVAYAQESEQGDPDPVIQTDKYGIPTMQGRSTLNRQANEADNKGAVFSMIGSDYDTTDGLKNVFKDFTPKTP